MKKKIFSAICLLLSAVCIFSACRKDNGNGGSDEQTGSAASGDSTASSANDLVLPYSNNDSLNPFFAVGTENISLTDLAYDPLFKVKADYTPENVIAEKGDITGTSVCSHCGAYISALVRQGDKTGYAFKAAVKYSVGKGVRRSCYVYALFTGPVCAECTQFSRCKKRHSR